MNKLIIDGTEYELIEETDRPTVSTLPQVAANGKLFWAKAIAKDYKPKEKDYKILKRDCNGFIATIQRLADSKLFCRGQQVAQGTIAGFIESRMMGNQLSLGVTFEDGSACKLSELEEVECRKEPLFKSWDGVAIFEGDEIWYVGENYEIDNWPAESIGCGEKGKAFSTKEAAYLYVLNYKPLLCLHDLESIHSKYRCFGQTLITHATELVKERLQNDTK